MTVIIIVVVVDIVVMQQDRIPDIPDSSGKCELDDGG